MKHQWTTSRGNGDPAELSGPITYCGACGTELVDEQQEAEECTPSTAELTLNAEEILPSRY
jgi:hypothetical protein